VDLASNGREFYEGSIEIFKLLEKIVVENEGKVCN
jgi:hypothetical protein